jgi:hypothetical protein
MKFRFYISPFFLLSIFLFSCGGLKGEFAIKKFGDDYFRKIANKNLQFRSSERINWVYKPKNVSGRTRVGVILLKKDISWIDISRRSDYVDMEKTAIYGEIYDLPPGRYRIILTEVLAKNRQVAQFNFSIFTETE